MDQRSNPLYIPNEMSAAFLGVCGLNPWHVNDASSRLQMLSQHLGQRLVIKGATERRFQTGMEAEYGKYTFKVDMPCDARILAVIERYPHTIGADSIKHNPYTLVVYEDVNTNEVGCLELTEYCTNHQYFGFDYAKRPELNQLRKDAIVKAGTVFLDSPGITNEGGYKYGVEAETAFVTIPAVAEDGVGVRRSFLKKLGFSMFESRVVSWGKNQTALNIYGDVDNPKVCPDIGDYIRPDGLLMALRNNEPADLGLNNKNIYSMMDIRYDHDTTIYATAGIGRVVDIIVHHDRADTNYAEEHTDVQIQKYDNARRNFYDKVLKTWHRLRAQRGDALELTPRFHQIVLHAESVMSEGGKQRVNKSYRKEPLDHYRVEFVIRYEITPSTGNKITNLHGGKGILVSVIDDEDMPIDEDGNIVDICMDGNSVINRANPGALYEQYKGAAVRDAHKRICSMLGIERFTRQYKAEKHLETLSKSVIEEARDYLMGLYETISPMHAEAAYEGLYTDPVAFLSEIVEKDIGIFLPTDNDLMSEDIVLNLEQKYRPKVGKLRYRGLDGEMVTTKADIMVGPMYYILLEKIGDDWSSVSSGKWQHFGVLAPLNKNDKYSRPARNQPMRVAGEAEQRNFAAYAGPEAFAEVHDRNNNPTTNRAIVEAILSDSQPSNIQRIVDRKTIPFLGSKPLQLLKHLAQVSGFKFKYTPHTPDWLGEENMKRELHGYTRFRAHVPKWVDKVISVWKHIWRKE